MEISNELGTAATEDVLQNLSEIFAKCYMRMEIR